MSSRWLLVVVLVLGACARTDSPTAVDTERSTVSDPGEPVAGTSLPSNGSTSDTVGQTLGTMTNR